MIDLKTLELNLKVGFQTLYKDYDSIFASKYFQKFHSLHNFLSQNKWSFKRDVIENYFLDESNIFFDQRLSKITCNRLTTSIEIDRVLMQKTVSSKNKIILNELINIEVTSELDFECFDKVVKPSDRATSYVASRKMSIFNVKNWQKYYVDLYSFNFPDYKVYQAKSKVQFLKKVSNNYFGFQLDLKGFSKQIKQGDLTLPSSTIVVTKAPLDESYEVLSDFKYPLLVEWPSPESFRVINKVDYSKDPVEINFHIVYEKQGEDVLITGDNVFGDLLKKNAQTYFTYSSPFLNSYLNFILNTITKKT
ncbi:MAG: hypothetical protein ACI8Q1_002560 [Parvicella sp.]|jgi:hypothetical protein